MILSSINNVKSITCRSTQVGQKKRIFGRFFLSLLRILCLRVLVAAKNQSFVEYFRTFRIIFRIFLNIFESFRTFLHILCLFVANKSVKSVANNLLLTSDFCLLSSNFVPLCLSGYQKSIKCAGGWEQKSKNLNFF